MRLGIYGGTFDPVHDAHIKAAEAFLRAFELDKLLVIPTGHHPRKGSDNTLAPRKRLQMCQMAFADMPRIEVSDIEIKREGNSYTATTLRELSSPEHELYFLCGTDMILTMGKWYMAEEIFKLCTVVYVRRESDSALDGEVADKINEYIEKYGAKIEKLNMEPIELSSTSLRSDAAEGKDISGSVPASVYKFIKDNRLYIKDMNGKMITDEMLASLRERACAEMSEKRKRHTLAVEVMATRLGAIYAPDKINILRAAALLHDVTKELKLDAQLALCEKYDISVADTDKFAPKTFHAKTAATMIMDKFPEFAHGEVVSAVRWHTTGREKMTICEKLIYLADYIDDSRKFADCVRLREYFWSADIDKMTEEEKLAHLRDTLILSYDMTIKNLLDENSPVAKDTFDARNELICERLKANETKG